MSLFRVFVFWNAGFGVEFCFPFDKPSNCVTVLLCGNGRFFGRKNYIQKIFCQTYKNKEFNIAHIDKQ